MNVEKNNQESNLPFEQLIVSKRADSPVYNQRVKEAKDLYRKTASELPTNEQRITYFKDLSQLTFEDEKEHTRFLYATGRLAIGIPDTPGYLPRPESPTHGFEAISQEVISVPLYEANSSEDIDRLIENRGQVARSCGRRSAEVCFIQRRIVSLLLNNPHSDEARLLQELKFYSEIEKVELSGYSIGVNQRRDFHLLILDKSTQILEVGLASASNELTWLETFMEFCYGPNERVGADAIFQTWFNDNSKRFRKNIHLLHQLDSKITLGFVSSFYNEIPFRLNYALRNMSFDNDLKKGCLKYYRDLESENFDEHCAAVEALRRIRYNYDIKSHTIKTKDVGETVEMISRLWDRYFLGHVVFKNKFLERLGQLLQSPDKGGDFIFKGGPKQIRDQATEFLAFAFNKNIIKYERLSGASHFNKLAYVDAVREYGSELFLVINEKKTPLDKDLLQFMTGKQSRSVYFESLGALTRASAKGTICVFFIKSEDREFVSPDDLFDLKATNPEDYFGRPITHYKRCYNMPDYEFITEAWDLFLEKFEDDIDDRNKMESRVFSLIKDWSHEENKSSNKVLIPQILIERMNK